MKLIFFRPILMGLMAALLVMIPRGLWQQFPEFSPGQSWSSPIFIFVITVVVILLKEFSFGQTAIRHPLKGYTGLADFLVDVHAPPTQGFPEKWGLRAVISFLLSLFGGSAGVEGASLEATQFFASRTRLYSSRWFEQLRRTDGACAIAAGISAAFGAPFAAIILPMELRIGGRALSTVLSAIAAFIAIKYFEYIFPVQSFSLPGATSFAGATGMNILPEITQLAVIVLVGGVFGIFLIKAVGFARESMFQVFRKKVWLCLLVGGFCLYLVTTAFEAGHRPSVLLMNDFISRKPELLDSTLMLVSQLLTFILVVSVFATAGILWPLFAIGGFLGYIISLFTIANKGVALVVGGAALWGAVMGAPVAGAVLAFELTRDLTVLFPAFLAAFGAFWIRKYFKISSLVETDLETRGIVLDEGRVRGVLESLPIRLIMVKDFEAVYERETVAKLLEMISKARYPFFPVVNAQGGYVGLLTADMVEESVETGETHSNSPLPDLLVAKDLLYRSDLNVPTLNSEDCLIATTGVFDRTPVVPVLDQNNQVVGLLFAYSVRTAYDQEIGRRALLFRRTKNQTGD